MCQRSVEVVLSFFYYKVKNMTVSFSSCIDIEKAIGGKNVKAIGRHVFYRSVNIKQLFLYAFHPTVTRKRNSNLLFSTPSARIPYTHILYTLLFAVCPRSYVPFHCHDKKEFEDVTKKKEILNSSFKRASISSNFC